MKISISCDWGGTIALYELKRDVGLLEHIDIICKELKAPDPSANYALFNETNNTYIKPENVTNVNFKLPDGTPLRLRLKPDLVAADSIEKLTSSDPEAKRKALTQMKSRLQDKDFAVAFLERNGISVLIAYVQEVSGNILGFALTTLEALMHHHVGWEKLDETFLQNIIPFISSSNLTASRRAIEIVSHLVKSPQHGFDAIDRAIRANATKETKKPYFVLVRLLASTDLNVKLAALTLVGELINSTPSDQHKKQFLHLLDDLGINKLLKEQVTTIQNQNFKEQLYLYQRARLWELQQLSDIAHDKENEEHEKMLLKLWSLVFPDTVLESRVSKQWKTMGFQGTDPATDLRGMGLLGLSNLLYMAEFHSDKLRKIIAVQSERKDHDYPVAVAGINLTKMLYELLHIGTEDPTKPIFNIFFDHAHAFEEMYCIAFQVLDHTWADMNASYMDWSNVIAAVRKQISDVLAQNPATIEMFHRVASWKQTGLHEEEDTAVEAGDQPDPLNKIRTKVRKNMTDLVKNQKLGYLREGCSFKAYGQKQKGNKNAQQYVFLRLHDSMQHLGWANTSSPTEKPTGELPNIVKQADFKGVVAGVECPVFQKRKLKPEDEEAVPLTFALSVASGESLTFVCQTPMDFVNWTDGLRGWIGAKMECPETLDDIKVLVETEIEVKMLDLEGITIPSIAPVVPPPPSNYDFFYKDKEEMTNQAVTETRRKGIALGRSRLGDGPSE